ncbi:MAG: right-handed parallel beta-helix repeat-containing protein, partial [Akkermansiaceae bacterium]|nr:right-handed parallel beta-helix repeat-containing protein [Verrucomicrobiales bacterium]
MKLIKHVLLTLALLAPATWAQTIPNPSFESNTFTVYPGYVSDNTAITGWTASPADRVGLNPASGNPFADNGVPPHGANVAFVQSTGSGSTLSTTITGLTSGAPYRVSFRANSRSQVVAPNPSWSLNGGAFVPFTASPIVNSQPYYANSNVFIATGTTASLVISNQTADDSTVLVDDFSIAPVPVGTWSVNAWTDDASSGIGSQTLWAYHFGNNNTAVVNGVTVPGTGTDGNPSVAGRFTVAGIPTVYFDDFNSLTDLGGSGSAVMAKSFIYNGNPGLITVEGLTIGQVYALSVYGVGFDAAPTARTSVFQSYADSLSVDENVFGNYEGLRVDYTFTALATTNLITVTPTNANTFHIYGLALRQPLLVTTASNAGPGSLRQAVLDAAALPGAGVITFAPALSGATITLASEIILNTDVTIDASSLPGGITVSGGNVTRIFTVLNNQTVSLCSLTLTGGNGVAANFSGTGGAIYNGGKLTINNCTLNYNKCGNFGGAIISDDTVEANNCTITHNEAGLGGGAISDGFGVEIFRFNHCTIVGNRCLNADGGGGIDAYNSTSITMGNTILASNKANGIVVNYETSGTPPPPLISTGYNLSDDAPSGLTGTGDLVNNANIKLGPLGNYGGPTQTMPPLPGSSAIDAAGPTTLTTDQRGSARNVGAAPDIGAVESGGLWVQNNNDSGANSLRDVLAGATSITNSKTILFTTNLSGATILLTTGQIILSNNVSIDASALAGGISINGNQASRIFQVANGNTALNSLTITGGSTIGDGGGILTDPSAFLILNNCTLAGNVASGSGGGIHYGGVAYQSMNNCTVVSNTAFNGGGVYVATYLNLNQCTIAQNNASDLGGGIHVSAGSIAGLVQCTVAGNSASLGAGIYNNEVLNYANCIIAANSGADIFLNGAGRGNREGANIIQNIGGFSSFPYTGTGTIINAAPLLAPLGNYGGSAKTMPPLPGSPAINAAGAPTFATDQRGYPRPVGLAADIGAVEGIYAAAGPGKITSITKLGNGSVRLSFTNLTDASFPVLATTNLSQSLSNWSVIGYATETSAGTGLIQFTDSQAPFNPQRFYRVR